MHTLDPNKLPDDGRNRRNNDDNNINNYENEETPLLSHRASADEATSSEQRLSIPKIIALTCINGGLQVFFSTIMANLAVCMDSRSSPLLSPPFLTPEPRHHHRILSQQQKHQKLTPDPLSSPKKTALPPIPPPLQILHSSHHHLHPPLGSLHRPSHRRPQRPAPHAFRPSKTHHPPRRHRDNIPSAPPRMDRRSHAFPPTQ